MLCVTEVIIETFDDDDSGQCNVPGGEGLREVVTVGQVLVKLSSWCVLQNDVYSILIPKVPIHAQNILLPAGRGREGESSLETGSQVM